MPPPCWPSASSRRSASRRPPRTPPPPTNSSCAVGWSAGTASAARLAPPTRWSSCTRPDALHITGPNPDQRGTATYRGRDGIRALAAKVADAQEKLAWRIETETANEKTATLVHVAAGPWGGPSVAVQLVEVYTDKASGKRWLVPGAGFFQIADGKIRRLRLYMADGERVEVEPDRKRP